jgi:hypothetical protein
MDKDLKGPSFLEKSMLTNADDPKPIEDVANISPAC